MTACDACPTLKLECLELKEICCILSQIFQEDDGRCELDMVHINFLNSQLDPTEATNPTFEAEVLVVSNDPFSAIRQEVAPESAATLGRQLDESISRYKDYTGDCAATKLRLLKQTEEALQDLIIQREMHKMYDVDAVFEAHYVPDSIKRRFGY